MKMIPALFVVLLLVSSPVFGDEVDDGLSKNAPEALKAHTREMIRAGVDSREALRMTRAMEQNRFQVANMIRAQEAVMGAVKDGIPPAPVMNKAYEGMTKRVQDREIVRAMEKTRERYSYAYQRARQIAGNDSEVQRTGNTVAEGMTAGLKSQDVDRIVARLQTRDRDRDQLGTRDRNRDRLHTLAQESFMTAREMVRYRVPSDTATNAVCAALEKSYQAHDMERLRMSFMNNARYGNAAQLANNYAAGIRNGALSGNLDAAGRYGNGWSSGSAGGSGSGSGSGGQGGSAGGASGAGGSGGAGGAGGSGAGGGRGGSGHGGGGR